MTTKSTAQEIHLSANPRSITGKAVRKLRKEHKVPGNLYGKDIESKNITVDSLDLLHVFKQAKYTGIVYMDIEGKSVPTMIANIQRDPIKRTFVHVDLRKIDLRQKVVAMAPVTIVGDAPAVKMHNGIVITQMEEVEVEALPKDMPSEIEVDVSNLDKIGAEISVAQLSMRGNYTIISDPERIVVSVIAHKEESTEVKTETAETEVIGEKPEPEDGAEETTTNEGN